MRNIRLFHNKKMSGNGHFCTLPDRAMNTNQSLLLIHHYSLRKLFTGLARAAFID
jgi:hypothetical protein